MPGALVAAFSYDTKVLLERHVAGRDLAVSVLEAGRPEALPIVEAIPREEDFYDFEARYEIGRTDFVCPADARRRVTARARRSSRSRPTELLGCYGFARVDLMLDDATGELSVLEANAIPGLTETSLLPQAAEAAGIGFDELDRARIARAGARARAGLSAAATGRRRRRSPRARPGRGTP